MSSAPEMGQGLGVLSRAAALVHEARCDFDLLDRQLGQHLAAARSMWGGDGGTAFQSLGQAWSERQGAIVRALDRFEDSLRSTESDNTQTDEAQSSAFARTHRRLA